MFKNKYISDLSKLFLCLHSQTTYPTLIQRTCFSVKNNEKAFILGCIKSVLCLEEVVLNVT